VIDTDYQSTNVSLLGLDGALLSVSFTSSYESGMSWDVAAPTMPSLGEDVVFLDRTFHLVTWVGVRTGDIRTQFHVDGDDLGRNPWDYLPITADKAYVLRYDPVPTKADSGDVIVVNPSAATVQSPVEARIDVAGALGLGKTNRVHPARGVVVGDRAYFTTVNATQDYVYFNSHLVVIDTETDAIVASKEITDLHDCNAIAASPDGTELALACAGDLEANSATSTDAAAVVRIATQDLSEIARYSASDLGAGVPGFSLSYAGSGVLVVTLVGNIADGVGDAVIALDLTTGQARELHSAGPVQIGATVCPARVDGSTTALDPPACFVTDADAFSVVRFPVEKGSLGAPKTIDVDEGRTRPPRYLGQF